MDENSALIKLLHPIDSKTFFDKYWDKRYLYIKKPADKNLHQIFSYQKLASILNSQIYNLRPYDIRVTNKGQIFDTESFIERSSHYVTAVRKERLKVSLTKLNKFIKEGAALVISEIHETDRELQAFAHMLHSDFGLPVSISTVHSCKGKATFTPHIDTTDLFVVHVEGEKRWTLDGYTVSPTSYRDETLFSKIDKTTREEVILRPGDVLYIPAGAWHDTAAITNNSLSINISIHSKRNIDLAYTILNLYLSQNLLNDEMLRKNMPLKKFLDKKVYKTEIKSILKTIKEDIASLLNDVDETDLTELLAVLNNSSQMNRGFTSSYDNQITFSEP